MRPMSSWPIRSRPRSGTSESETAVDDVTATRTTSRPAARRGRPANTSSEETAAAILNAARRLFAARGYAETSNQLVAGAAGLTHTAIYNHFGSKAKLFTAVFVDVQDLLIVELERSARATPDELPFPRALLDAIETLRRTDPSYVDFLASMYVEVRRHAELREIFRGGTRFAIVDTIGALAGGDGVGGTDGSMWFWIALALGLAQLSTLADADTFAATVATVRQQIATTP